MISNGRKTGIISVNFVISRCSMDHYTRNPQDILQR